MLLWLPRLIQWPFLSRLLIENETKSSSFDRGQCEKTSGGLGWVQDDDLPGKTIQMERREKYFRTVLERRLKREV